MILGILSDTHDNLESIETALNIFAQQDVQLVVHCGDWKSPSTVYYFVKKLAELNLKARGVFGNNDLEKERIAEINLENGNVIDFGNGLYNEFESDGKKIAVTHGHHKQSLQMLTTSGRFDTIFTGHTHKPKVESIKETLILNPGSTAFSIPRSKDKPKSVAVYNTADALPKIILF